ncbi:MAG: PAS domain-containing protein, partial [Planctomycetes bacterium]|nr:PAS domain-containing protein [Planctomycetota bacterium]
VPVSGAEKLLAVIVLGDMAAGDTFGEADTALMAALGNVVAIAAETALLHAEFRLQMGRRLTETMADLTRATVEIQRLKTFNEELYQSVPVGIIVFDREFHVTFRNAAAERLWPDDRTVVAAVRRTNVARLDPEWEHGLREVIDMRRPWLAVEVVLDRPGKDALRLNLSCSPLVSMRGDVMGGVLVVEDVTTRIRMAERLAVSERLAGVGRLAAMVAHEINNPLDGILRLVNLARRAGAEGDGERIERYLVEVRKGLMRMVAIVRELLDFSRSASGEVEPMPIREVLGEAVRNMEPVAQKAGVAVEIACGADLPALRSGSLYQVVLNLVKNAIEATPEGGRVRVSGGCAGDTLVIEVADTGPGIPEGILARLFEPFVSLKALGKGTGLGLVICRDLVQKQGGTIVAANRPEGGAVFTVTIPLAPGTCPRPGSDGA